jgi:Dyp-type peroxidase family
VATPDLNGERDDIQGLLASGYGHLPHAAYLLFTIDDGAAAAKWVRWLAETVTTAWARESRRSANVALSATALAKLGLSAGALGGFSLEFSGGMVDDAHRRRILGDVGDNAPELWAWGGPDTPSIDLLLLLFGETPHELRTLTDEHRREVRGATLMLELQASGGTFDHFGFRDGISQPSVAGLRSGPSAQTVKAGEFLLGYRNEYGQFTDRPLLDPREDPDGVLPDDAAGSGRRDLGRNGSYLVFRQLQQDVPGFWRWVDSATAASAGSGDRWGEHPEQRRIALAAKLVGRWPGGAPLTLSPERDDPELATATDFGYFARDADGTRCPIGAHVRRSHPRDSLDPSPGSAGSIKLDKHHRLLRRGRKYGSALTPDEALAGRSGEDEERGLHFICLCASIERQFEFVQRTWVNSPKFGGLYDDADPLVGVGPRNFTIQAEPLRRRYRDLPAFIKTRGGGYFFLPGVRGLEYMASLAETGS